MILYHATLRSNLRSIRELGLDRSFSRGKMNVVWLHCLAKRHWAVCHTIRRHSASPSDIVILRVSVPRSWLRKSRRGLWYSTLSIQPGRISLAAGWTEISDSPVT